MSQSFPTLFKRRSQPMVSVRANNAALRSDVRKNRVLDITRKTLMVAEDWIS